MILHIDGLFLYGTMVLVILVVSITTLIAYKKEKELMNKSFLGGLLILVGVLMCMVPLFVHEMFRFILS
ncbi:hypothetical protein [Lysinibacillus sphaericus]|uniref:hypothetical protein n=1 Tax=Lysinibacillus sphaericus TaxID=1421 RepID=UPI000C183A4E|nr:hypothetical protein [Lysinibacillus sphaericus]PIJ98163.1 hypothetical protein CTN02_10500 [Lysinibacillus sphaericus]